MKRLIKFWNQYGGTAFSDSSTEYELFPVIKDDSAGNVELRALAIVAGIKLDGKAVPSVAKNEGYRGYKGLQITNAIKTTEIKTVKRWDKVETYPVYIGFITIPEGKLAIKETLGNELTKDQAYEIVNSDGQTFGIDDVGTMQDETPIIVMSGWNYFHALKVAGYSPDSFRDAFDVNEDGEQFHDSVFRCSDCGTYDYNDSGYTYNYRIVGCEIFGLNCGCYAGYMEKPEALEDFVNDANQCVEREVIEAHANAGRLEELETYIGGMTDGRGGYINGKSVRDGDPKTILAELLKKNPKGKYVFSRDDSGQFQTYFSVWKVRAEKRKAKKASKTKGVKR